MTGRRIIVSSVLLLLLFSGFASRGDDSAPDRVGAIDVTEGEVAIRPPVGGRANGDSRPGAWSEAGRNDPVASGMAVRTATASRAVLRVGADLVALSDAAEADIVRLDKAGAVLALRRGRLGVHLSGHDSGRATEIAIPGGTLRLFAPGDYEIAAGDDKSDGKSPARLAVLAGTARVSGKGLDAVVASGGAVLLSGSDPVAMAPADTEADAFSEWWRAQRRSPTDSPALRHVAAAVTGHDMLDRYGAWESLADFGAVWFPRELPRDWAPYRHGRWRWINPWGWTWIDDMPWGFATSHYGRWANLGGSDGEAGRWGWVPGERVDDPVFMPAAVAFLGTAGVGLSYPDAFRPAIAWFPLAPGEVYWPSFTDDPDTIRRLNAGAGADLATVGAAPRADPPADIVTGTYRNRRHASVVPRAVFVGGRPVAEAVIDLPVRRLENAPLLAGSPGIEPPGASPPARSAANAAASANLTKARETLAHIVTFPEPRKPAVETAVSRRPAAKTLAAETHAPKQRAVRKPDSRRIDRPAAPRARSATSVKTPPRRVDTGGRPSKSHAAELRHSDARGG